MFKTIRPIVIIMLLVALSPSAFAYRTNTHHTSVQGYLDKLHAEFLTTERRIHNLEKLLVHYTERMKINKEMGHLARVARYEAKIANSQEVLRQLRMHLELISEEEAVTESEYSDLLDVDHQGIDYDPVEETTTAEYLEELELDHDFGTVEG